MTREVPGRGPVRLHPAIWILLGVATLGILLGAAEQHDQTCYSKAAVQAVSGNRELEGCLLLPWNDAVAPPMVPKSSDRRR